MPRYIASEAPPHISGWGRDEMDDPLEILKPTIDSTVSRLTETTFRIDPIAERTYSRMTSIISSAYKRHGQILEEAFRVVLSQFEPRFSVWEEQNFKVSSRADSLTADLNRLVRDENWRELLDTQLAYGDESRILQIDAVVYDREDNIIRTYEIKRGNGAHDSQKKRQMIRDIVCTGLLLRGYAKSEGIKNPVIAEAKILFYYGVRSIPEPLSLVGGELDEHFGVPIFRNFQRINSYYSSQLHKLLESIEETETDDMVH